MSSAICPLCHHDPERALEHWGCDCECHVVDHDPPRVAEDEAAVVAAGEGCL